MSDAPTLEAFSTALSDIVGAAAPSVVGVQSRRSLASGFAWRADLVVTADESVAEHGEVAVILDGGERRPATIVGRDPTTDVALLRVDGAALAAIKFEPAPVRPGALIVGVGARGGAALTAFGAVASVGPAWRSMRGGEIDARIELDLRLRREAEGGLVFDAGGRAFGMTVSGPRRRTLVIPGATIERVAAKLESHGRVPRGYLGLALRPVRIDGDGSTGAIVIGVEKDGPGDTAGIRQGDVIAAWDAKPLPDLGAMLRALGPDSVGRVVTLGLRRGGVPLEVTLTIGERPAE